MPEESSTSPENKSTVAVDTAALGASIADGIAKNLAPILERSSQPASRPGPEQSPPAPVILPEPSIDEITAAQEAGDYKLAGKLMRQREAARDARHEAAFAQLRNQGAGALSSMARENASKLPRYTKYQKEIDEMVADFQAKNPGVMITPDHYKTAHDIIVGRHADDLAREATEEALRRARDTKTAIEPGGDGDEAAGEKEPASVAEEFAGTPFLKQFQTKARAVGGRSLEQEVQIMNRGIKDARLKDDKGRPKRDYTEADYLKERREMAAIYEENPSMGLDE